MNVIEKAIQDEIAKHDESVQVRNGKDGYTVLHNGEKFYFAHHLNDGAREEANREAKCLINKLKKKNKTVYVYLQ